MIGMQARRLLQDRYWRVPVIAIPLINTVTVFVLGFVGPRSDQSGLGIGIVVGVLVAEALWLTGVLARRRALSVSRVLVSLVVLTAVTVVALVVLYPVGFIIHCGIRGSCGAT